MSYRFVMRDIDLSALRSRMPSAMRGSLYVVAGTVLADATPKVPMSTRDSRGNLRASGTPRTMNDNTAQVEWGGDGKTSRYAGPQHAGHAGGRVFRNYTTLGTGAKWTEKAKSEREGAWRRMFAQEYARRVHG
ncbi:MAG: hypothetical protein IKG69_03865 [Atopobiaceae bacterium]|nr:hypothetical protein [Atopobiaceae bacterium]